MKIRIFVPVNYHVQGYAFYKIHYFILNSNIHHISLEIQNFHFSMFIREKQTNPIITKKK
jgi:hypothetical protein